MQPWLMVLEEDKHSVTTVRPNRPRGLQLRILQLLVVFLCVGIVYSILSIYMTKNLISVQDGIPVIQSQVESSYAEQGSLGSWIRPPSNLCHSMNDTELFWRALMIKGYPFKRTPKIAFMFLTRGPLPMAPLWERFFRGHEELYSIYIHSGPNYQPDYSPLSVFYKRQIPSQVVEWGEPSTSDSVRRLLGNALLDISNEWFVLLSEACIPLHNFSLVYRYISSSQYSFIASFDEHGPWGRGRYNPNMVPEVNITEWRKGWTWFEINRKLALDIIKDDILYPKFKQFCRPDCLMDEHYFPTILSIRSPHLLANRTLTWVDWSRGGLHPVTFGKADIKEELFERIFQGQTCTYNNQPSSVCFLFARKFAPSALESLLEYASKFFGF